MMTNEAKAAAPATPKATQPWYKSFGLQVLIGLVAGVVLGLIARQLGVVVVEGEDTPNWLTSTLDTVGSSYVQLLRVAVIPLVVTAVITSIAQLRTVANAARLATQTLLWFAITALIAVLVGIGVCTLFHPGRSTSVTEDLAKEPSRVGDWWAFITGLVPNNFLGLGVSTSLSGESASSSVSLNVLQILVISIVVGIAAVKVGKAAEPFLATVASLLAIIQKVLWWIIRIAPIGTAALIGHAVADYGWSALRSLGAFSIAIYVGLAIVFFLVYPALVAAHGLSIKQFFSGVWPVAQLGFVSRSSLGVLPLTQRVTERSLGVPSGYASFVVPLGATTKMDGCASIYPAIAAIFVAEFYQIPLTFTDYLLIVVVSVIGSAATAGTTGATVMLTLTLSTLGLPLAGVGLLLAVEPIIDMGRTAVNVTGQALIPTLVAKREGILDLEAYNAPRDYTLDVDPAREVDTAAASETEAAGVAVTADGEDTAVRGSQGARVEAAR